MTNRSLLQPEGGAIPRKTTKSIVPVEHIAGQPELEELTAPVVG